VIVAIVGQHQSHLSLFWLWKPGFM
jgi:hypothetical protein